jgi:hypothetical protein
VRSAWEVKGWLVDGLTQLWAQVIEEGMKGGDGSSSEVRGGHAGVSADVERRGIASGGDAGTGRKGQATRGEGEQEVEGGALHGGGRGKKLQRRQKQSRGAERLRGRR